MPSYQMDTGLILVRRVSVLHGRLVSISNSEVDAELPSDIPMLRGKDGIDNLPNVLAMIRLTAFLEEARDKM